MSREEVFERLLPELADVFGVEPDEITVQTDMFEELGADRFDMTEISMITEEEFDILTDDEVFSGIKTVRQLCDYVCDKAE